MNQMSLNERSDSSTQARKLLDLATYAAVGEEKKEREQTICLPSQSSIGVKELILPQWWNCPGDMDRV